MLCAPYATARAQTPEEETLNLRYATIVHGYHAVDTIASYAVRPWGYGATAHVVSVGLASWFLTINLTSTVEGHFVGDDTQPLSYDSQGYSRGSQRHVHLTFDKAGLHITEQTPFDDDREPISSDQLEHSKDILSSLLALLHQLDTKNSCTLSGTVFDGLRLMRIDAHGPIHDDVPTNHNAYYSGDALRCDFTGRQIGGFVQGSAHKAEQASPHPGTAWFKRLDNGRVIPVRIEFQHPKLGKLILVLQSAPTLTKETNTTGSHP